MNTLEKVNSKLIKFLREKHVIKHIPTNNFYQCINIRDNTCSFYLNPKDEQLV